MPSSEPKNIPLNGPEWQPPGYSGASPDLRRRWWNRLGFHASAVKRSEILAGIGTNGRKLVAVKLESRPDKAGGPPLIPHDESSRTYRLLHYRAGRDGVTLYWKGHGRTSWSTILGYHAYKHGPRSLPIRNTIGISTKGGKKAYSMALSEWNRWVEKSRSKPRIKSSPKPFMYGKAKV